MDGGVATEPDRQGRWSVRRAKPIDDLFISAFQSHNDPPAVEAGGSTNKDASSFSKRREKRSLVRKQRVENPCDE